MPLYIIQIILYFHTVYAYLDTCLKEKEWESYSLLICLLHFCWINGHTTLNLLIIQVKQNYDVRIQQKL